MVKPLKRLIEHAYFAKKLFMQGNEKTMVGISMTLAECIVSDEQMGKLLEILDKAAEEANTVMGW